MERVGRLSSTAASMNSPAEGVSAMDRDIFVSIGTPSTKNQEKALKSLNRVLESRGLRRRSPLSSHKAPLTSVRDTLDKCAGMIVVAYPRIVINEGLERPSSTKEEKLTNVALTTPWNHMEAAFAYDRGLPLMVLRDKSVKVEGFVEYTYDWKVEAIEFSSDYMNSYEFASMVNEFVNQIDDYIAGRWQRFSTKRPSALADLSLKDILSLKWPDISAILGGAVTLLGAAFYLGHKIGGLFF